MLAKTLVYDGAFDGELAHMRDVEEAGARADSLVLVEDAAELDRQLPAAEVDHFAAQFVLEGVEGSFFQVGGVLGHSIGPPEATAH